MISYQPQRCLEASCLVLCSLMYIVKVRHCRPNWQQPLVATPAATQKGHMSTHHTWLATHRPTLAGIADTYWHNVPPQSCGKCRRTQPFHLICRTARHVALATGEVCNCQDAGPADMVITCSNGCCKPGNSTTVRVRRKAVAMQGQVPLLLGPTGACGVTSLRVKGHIWRLGKLATHH
jgi:hypothetical protein